MAYCSKCGKEVMDEAEICVHCGCRIKSAPMLSANDGNNFVRFLLTFFLGWIGSFIINHTNLKPEGWKSRTCAYFFWYLLPPVGFIHHIVASVCNFSFNAKQGSNIGYFKD